MSTVEVGKLMNRSVMTTTAEALLPEVVHLMRENKASCVVVIEKSQPIGIVTERDLVRILGELLNENCERNVKVKEFMTNSPVLVNDKTSLFDALVITQSRGIRHLPVTDQEGILCGMLAYSDLAQAYEHVIEEQREIIEHELNTETRRLREVNDQLKALSMEDALLGIGNRRSMEVDISYTHSAALRYQRAYSIVLYDVDYFKQYNDHYGHQAGDDALRVVTEHIRCAIRQSDRLYRYGGEELLLLLPETDYEGAVITAKRIVNDLAERNIPHVKSPLGVLTMSGGVASPVLDGMVISDWRGIVGMADKHLYDAKTNGRNRVSELGPVDLDYDEQPKPGQHEQPAPAAKQAAS